MVRKLQEEAEEWRGLIRSISAEQLLEERVAFDRMRNIRGFLFHIGQHLIYKEGQIRMLYYEMGLDGPEPYAAPYPDEIYGFTDSPPWPVPRE